MFEYFVVSMMVVIILQLGWLMRDAGRILNWLEIINKNIHEYGLKK